MKNRNYLRGILILAAALSAWPAAAQIEWEGVLSSDWNDGLNWNPVGPPAPDIDVVIDTGFPNDPTVDGVNAGAAEIHIGPNASAALEIVNGGTLASGPAVLGGNAGSGGAAIIDGAGSEWNIGGSLTVGGEGVGLVTVANAATLSNTFGGTIAAEEGSEGTMLVTGPGSTWSTGFTIVGFRGTGSLDIAASGQVTSAGASVGHSNGASGVVSVDGAGSVWNVTNNIILGDQTGSGILSITGGGTVVTGGNGSLGVGNSAAGSAALDGPDSAWEIGGELRVGRFGAGSLSIGGGAAVVVTGAALVPAEQGSASQGELAVNGIIVPAGGLFVNPMGLLAGTGEVQGDTTIAGGVIAPGESVGTLGIAGDLLLQDDAILDFELDGPIDPADRIDVTGNLVLDGTLEITDLGGLAPGVYTLIQYGGSLTDNGLVVSGLPPDLVAMVDVSDPGQVNLIVEEFSDVIFADRFEP